MRLVQPTATEFEALFDGETRRVWICSPWISKEGIALLAKALARAPGLEELDLWLRVDASCTAMTDFFAIETFLEHLSQSSVRVFIHSAPKLHAKAIWTTKGALIGSMNLTLNGMTGRNVELAVRLEPEEIAAQQSIRELLRVGVERVSEYAWRRFLASLSSAGGDNDSELVLPAIACAPTPMKAGPTLIQAPEPTNDRKYEPVQSAPTPGKCGKPIHGGKFCNRLPGHDSDSKDVEGKRVAATPCSTIPF